MFQSRSSTFYIKFNLPTNYSGQRGESGAGETGPCGRQQAPLEDPHEEADVERRAADEHRFGRDLQEIARARLPNPSSRKKMIAYFSLRPEELGESQELVSGR